MTGNHVYEITDCRKATNSNNRMARLRKNWFLEFCQSPPAALRKSAELGFCGTSTPTCAN